MANTRKDSSNSLLPEAAVVEILKEMGQSSYKPIAEMCVPVLKDY